MNNWYAIYPEKRYYSDAEVILWAQDCIANGEPGTDGITDADVANDPKFAVSVLMDAGVATFARAPA